jgi:hypothetical protein
LLLVWRRRRRVRDGRLVYRGLAATVLVESLLSLLALLARAHGDEVAYRGFVERSG